ncbi:guanylate kinase [Diaporthe amygdali]|uniref:guanylate kinase n=1 Tax=Phomopsis amygdali TaxID=1214568 RepID=UPI0022FE7288|nr:guanylate kinase [Diaporthe amygdali]KAJ0118276.1 guanylate kinase [Diaporthe amygdali]
MPSLEVDDYGVTPVTTFVSFFEEALDAASAIKPTAAIDPPLEEADLEGVLSRLPETPHANESQDTRQRKHHRFAVIETAARGILSNLIAQVPIDSNDFVRIWNLFDILQCLSDRGQCDPALLVWLLEDLLDSQTIPGCRKIFDYLESRRQRIISRNFAEKKLIILRSCNELLRRLSRAEDTSFSGRVFIFLFQSFPLGDKSSVNLRGEYHTQNVTIYDQEASKADHAEDKMDVDSETTPAKDGERPVPSKAVSFSDKKEAALEKPLDADALYPVFWSLQESFNQPKKLFSPPHFSQFKTSLQASMAAFKARPVQQEPKSSKQAEDSKRGLKRKRSSDVDTIVDTFNPKYLTSRDLFELEIGDLSLRRYVLFQALIIMDFLLSLAPKAKEELSSIPQVNKSVAYLDQTLSEEDIKWATSMKSDISKYLLSTTPDGPFFLRLVETVLIRDKNWVRWKIENCPPIERPAVTPQEWAETMSNAKSLSTNKRLRREAMGSLSLDFLNDEQDANAVEKLKDPERYQLPELKSFKRKIQEDDLEIEMPLSNDSKAAAVEGKASKTWRALRIASRSKLALFDQIESYEDINILFEEKKPEEEAHENGESGENGDVGDNDQTMDEVKEQESEPALENGNSEAAAVTAEVVSTEA